MTVDRDEKYDVAFSKFYQKFLITDCYPELQADILGIVIEPNEGAAQQEQSKRADQL